jgi:hypothetical protein
MSNGESIVEQELTPAPLAFVGEQLSPSPYHFRFTGEDFLEIASYNSQSGIRVAVQGRTWHPGGEIRPFAFTHIPNTDRSRAIEVFGLANGYLLNAVAFAATGAPRVGQTFVSLHVIRGLAGARVLLATLLQGYITAEQELAFPGSPVLNSVESGGVLRTIFGTNPAAGLEFSETVPSGAQWEILTIRVGFTTDANVANRRPSVQFLSGGGLVYQAPLFTTIPASSGPALSWGQGMSYESAPGTSLLIAGLPIGLRLLGGDIVRSVTENLRAGDDYNAPTLLVREWLEAQ